MVMVILKIKIMANTYLEQRIIKRWPKRSPTIAAAAVVVEVVVAEYRRIDSD